MFVDKTAQASLRSKKKQDKKKSHENLRGLKQKKLKLPTFVHTKRQKTSQRKI